MSTDARPASRRKTAAAVFPHRVIDDVKVELKIDLGIAALLKRDRDIGYSKQPLPMGAGRGRHAVLKDKFVERPLRSIRKHHGARH
jgi:hypothetical protein